MKKMKKLYLLFLGLLLFLPFVKISPAQEDYIGVQDGNEYLWRLGIHKVNWGEYFMDNLEETLNILWPLGESDMTNVYLDWLPWHIDPPQSHWPFSIIAIGSEETGSLLFPFDDTIITATPVNATAGWELSNYNPYHSYYNGTWYIVNDTSSFLRQTLNLTLSFSPYGMMGVPFAPKTINWAYFITEFLGVMNSRGAFYNSISATAKSNGYSLYVPPRGFENNSVAIDILVKYNSNGVLTYYEFKYGGKLLTNYWLYVPDTIAVGDILSIIYGGGLILGIALFILIIKRILKNN